MRIAVTSTDSISLHALHDWFAADDDVARAADVSMGSSGAHPGSQSALDYIDVVLSNATAIASLVVAYASWRKSGTAEPDTRVTFQVGERRYTVEGADPETIERLVEALEAAADSDGAAGKP